MDAYFGMNADGTAAALAGEGAHVELRWLGQSAAIFPGDGAVKKAGQSLSNLESHGAAAAVPLAAAFATSAANT
jgi:hypothetical protein